MGILHSFLIKNLIFLLDCCDIGSPKGLQIVLFDWFENLTCKLTHANSWSRYKIRINDEELFNGVDLVLISPSFDRCHRLQDTISLILSTWCGQVVSFLLSFLNKAGLLIPRATIYYLLTNDIVFFIRLVTVIVPRIFFIISWRENPFLLYFAYWLMPKAPLKEFICYLTKRHPVVRLLFSSFGKCGFTPLLPLLPGPLCPGVGNTC